MKIGDLVRCRPRNERENYDEWLGLIIGEPPLAKTVHWVCSGGRDPHYKVNHSPEELEVISENR